MSVSEELRTTIIDSGVVAAHLAKRSGVEPAVISRFLRGRRIHAWTLERLADACGYTLELRAKEVGGEVYGNFVPTESRSRNRRRPVEAVT